MAYFAREEPRQYQQPQQSQFHQPQQSQFQNHRQPLQPQQPQQQQQQQWVREQQQPQAGPTRRDHVWEQKRQRHEQRKAQRRAGGGAAPVATVPTPAPAPAPTTAMHAARSNPQQHTGASFGADPASRAHAAPGGASSAFGTSGRAGGARKPRREATVTSSSAVRHVVAPRPAQQRAPMGRDELEKQRLASRTGGYHQYEGGAQPVGGNAADDGRFGYDFASEEAARRQAANARKQGIYAAQRSDIMAREQHNSVRSGGSMGGALQDASNQPQYAMQQQAKPQPQHGRRSLSREAPPSAAYASIDQGPAAPPQGRAQYGRRSDSRGMDGGYTPPASTGGGGYAPRGHTSVRMHAPPGGASQITFG